LAEARKSVICKGQVGITKNIEINEQVVRRAKPKKEREGGTN
jgi:hypothetical protein